MTDKERLSFDDLVVGDTFFIKREGLLSGKSEIGSDEDTLRKVLDVFAKDNGIQGVAFSRFPYGGIYLTVIVNQLDSASYYSSQKGWDALQDFVPEYPIPGSFRQMNYSAAKLTEYPSESSSVNHSSSQQATMYSGSRIKNLSFEDVERDIRRDKVDGLELVGIIRFV